MSSSFGVDQLKLSCFNLWPLFMNIDLLLSLALEYFAWICFVPTYWWQKLIEIISNVSKLHPYLQPHPPRFYSNWSSQLCSTYSMSLPSSSSSTSSSSYLSSQWMRNYLQGFAVSCCAGLKSSSTFLAAAATWHLKVICDEIDWRCWVMSGKLPEQWGSDKEEIPQGHYLVKWLQMKVFLYDMLWITESILMIIGTILWKWKGKFWQ